LDGLGPAGPLGHRAAERGQPVARGGLGLSLLESASLYALNPRYALLQSLSAPRSVLERGTRCSASATCPGSRAPTPTPACDPQGRGAAPPVLRALFGLSRTTSCSTLPSRASAARRTRDRGGARPRALLRGRGRAGAGGRLLVRGGGGTGRDGRWGTRWRRGPACACARAAAPHAARASRSCAAATRWGRARGRWHSRPSIPASTASRSACRLGTCPGSSPTRSTCSRPTRRRDGGSARVAARALRSSGRRPRRFLRWGDGLRARPRSTLVGVGALPGSRRRGRRQGGGPPPLPPWDPRRGSSAHLLRDGEPAGPRPDGPHRPGLRDQGGRGLPDLGAGAGRQPLLGRRRTGVLVRLGPHLDRVARVAQSPSPASAPSTKRPTAAWTWTRCGPSSSSSTAARRSPGSQGTIWIDDVGIY
jgi:hypothetical protein